MVITKSGSIKQTWNELKPILKISKTVYTFISFFPLYGRSKEYGTPATAKREGVLLKWDSTKNEKDYNNYLKG